LICKYVTVRVSQSIRNYLNISYLRDEDFLMKLIDNSKYLIGGIFNVPQCNEDFIREVIWLIG